MADNKVVLADGTTLMDLSDDTIIAAALLKGFTAHGADGEPIIGELEQSSGKPKIATGTFKASGSTSVNVTFDEELADVPDLIIFHETNSDYVSYNRIKYAVGSKSVPLYAYQSSGSTRYITEAYVRGSTGNTTSFYYSTTADISGGGIDYEGTSVGSPIKNAKATGFSAFAYSNSYLLYGTYRYYAICF